MSVVSKQGQSGITPDKERGLSAAFTVNLKMFKSINARHGDRFTYFHFDLNSGSGMNDEFNCIGSPLAFVSAAEKVGVERYFAFFCDINESALGDLGRRRAIRDNPRCFLHHGNNASLVDAIPDLIRHHEKPEKAIGMVLSDPNDSGVPFDQLAELSDICPRMDFCINWNSRLFKLYQGHKWGQDRHTLASATALFGKAHWLIREPLGNWHWTLMIGRNYKTGDHRSLGFHHRDGDMGQRIFNQCNYLNRDNPDRRVDQQLAMAF